MTMPANRMIFSLLLFILLLVAVAYGSVGHVGFYLDDYASIVNNQLFVPPVDWGSLIEAYKLRSVAYLWLAFQYQMFAETAAFYHYLGLGVHLLVSACVSGLIYLLLRRDSGRKKIVFAFMGGALFLLHPQNSQTVIYIVQQIALLVSLFYLLGLISFCLYLNARSGAVAKLAVAGTLLFGLLACLTKQNAFTYPLMLLLLDGFYRRAFPIRLKVYMAGAGLFVLGVLLYLQGDMAKLWAMIDRASRETLEISRMDYFLTQLVVVKDYLLQFFIPFPLRMEYSSTLYSLQDKAVWGALLLHILLLGSAVGLRTRLPLYALGIGFYYIAHLVESSVIPIRDLAFEHRTYLPNVGLVLAGVGLLDGLDGRWARRPVVTWLWWTGVAMLIVFALIVQQRVQVWADKTAFYQHELKYTKDRPRPYLGLAEEHMNSGSCELAIGYFEHALNLYEKEARQDERPQLGLFQNYILCLQQLGIRDKALFYYDALLKQIAQAKPRSALLSQLGAYHFELNNIRQAEKYLRQALALDTKNYHAVINYAVLQLHSAQPHSAVPMLRYALKLKPNDPLAVSMLAELGVDNEP